MSRYHLALINFKTRLGYSRGACCHGFAVTWIIDCLIHQESMYFSRIERIFSQGNNLIEEIQAAKAKKGQNLTAKDQEMLDIVAFCENVSLYQTPKLCASFYKPLQQRKIVEISQFAASAEVERHGGLQEIHSHLGIFTSYDYVAQVDTEAFHELPLDYEPITYVLKLNPQIANYLNRLSEIFQQTCSHRVGLLLGSYTHSIGIVYDPMDQSWTVMDSNQWPPLLSTSAEEIAKTIAKTFTGNDGSFCIAFRTQIFVLAQKNSTNMIEQLNHLKNEQLNAITAEIAMKSDGVNAIHLAAQENEVDGIHKLLSQGVEIESLTQSGHTPLYVATENEATEAANFLLSQGASNPHNFFFLQTICSDQEKNYSHEKYRCSVEEDSNLSHCIL